MQTIFPQNNNLNELKMPFIENLKQPRPSAPFNIDTMNELRQIAPSRAPVHDLFPKNNQKTRSQSKDANYRKDSVQLLNFKK